MELEIERMRISEQEMIKSMENTDKVEVKSKECIDEACQTL